MENNINVFNSLKAKYNNKNNNYITYNNSIINNISIFNTRINNNITLKNNYSFLNCNILNYVFNMNNKISLLNLISYIFEYLYLKISINNIITKYSIADNTIDYSNLFNELNAHFDNLNYSSLNSHYIYKEIYSLYLVNTHDEFISILIYLWSDICLNNISYVVTTLLTVCNNDLNYKNNKVFYFSIFLFKLINMYIFKIKNLYNCFIYISSKLNFNTTDLKNEYREANYKSIDNIMHIILFQSLFNKLLSKKLTLLYINL